MELISDEPNMVDQVSVRRRTMSLGSNKAPRSRTSSFGSAQAQSLRRKTLNASLQAKVSQNESH